MTHTHVGDARLAEAEMVRTLKPQRNVHLQQEPKEGQVNLGSALLRSWIDQQDETRLTVWAAKIGTSPGYLHDLLNSRRSPSIRLAFLIEEITEGAVFVSSWVTSV